MGICQLFLSVLLPRSFPLQTPIGYYPVSCLPRLLLPRMQFSPGRVRDEIQMKDH